MKWFFLITGAFIVGLAVSPWFVPFMKNRFVPWLKERVRKWRS